MDIPIANKQLFKSPTYQKAGCLNNFNQGTGWSFVVGGGAMSLNDSTMAFLR